MKLKAEQVMYLRSMGKALRVTGIFLSDDSANRFCGSPAGKDHGVVAVFGPYIFTAHLYDKGVKIDEGNRT